MTALNLAKTGREKQKRGNWGGKAETPPQCCLPKRQSPLGRPRMDNVPESPHSAVEKDVGLGSPLLKLLLAHPPSQPAGIGGLGEDSKLARPALLAGRGPSPTAVLAKGQRPGHTQKVKSDPQVCRLGDGGDTGTINQRQMSRRKLTG